MKHKTDRMLILAAELRQKSDALFAAHAIMVADETAKKAKQTRTVLAKAVTLETQRLNGRHVALLPSAKARPKRTGSVAQRQAATSAFLALFSETEPRRPDHPRVTHGIAKLISNGYLVRATQRTPEGEPMYLRGSKPYATTGTAPSLTLKDRKRVQRFLWKFSTKKSRVFETHYSYDSLVADGYLVKNGDGYRRTSKRYLLESPPA